LHVVYFASPFKKYFPENDCHGTIYSSVDVFLGGMFPRLLAAGGGSGKRQDILCVVSYAGPPQKCLPGSDRAGIIYDHVDVLLDATFPRLLPEHGDHGTRQTVCCVVYCGHSESDLSGSGQWGISETLPAFS
jgi:hypothetical protein